MSMTLWIVLGLAAVLVIAIVVAAILAFPRDGSF